MSSTGFVVSWTMPMPADHNGIIRSYTVNITEENTGTHTIFTSHTSSQRIDSLHPYYNYTCLVAAVTVSAGPFSPPITITTAESGTMVHLIIIMYYLENISTHSPQWTSSKHSNNTNLFNIHCSQMGSTFAPRTQWSHYQLYYNCHI